MVRTAQATTFTFAGTKHFDDGPEAFAQWASDRINVRPSNSDKSGQYLLNRGYKSHSEPTVSYFFPKGVGEYHYGVGLICQSTELLLKLSIGHSSHETSQVDPYKFASHWLQAR